MTTNEPYPLANAYWKVERAEEHLKTLDDAIKRYRHPRSGEPQPYRVTANKEPEKDAICYRFEINQPHVRIFLIAADAIQCLRSALDHAIWSLASLKFLDPDWTEFPILAKAPNSDQRKKFADKLWGLSPEAIAYIESLQPYNRPTGLPLSSHLLFQLHEINRIDKHRRILVRVVLSGLMTSSFGEGGPGREGSDFPWEATETDYGYEVRRFGGYKGVEPEVTLLVVFGESESGITLPLSGLWDINNYVRNEVVPRLSGFAK